MRLSDKYPFLTNYFTELICSEKFPLPQSLIFYGNDFVSQYILANEIARFLNCKKNKADDCDCLNCRWINEGNHPAVLTISKSDNKPEDDTSKTVISINQAKMIKNSLVTASEFHRVFIFCDRDDEGNVCGLTQETFQAEAANSLLKIIEEPNPNITFIFLTRNLDNIIPTIISRSQCFFVPSKVRPAYNYDLIKGIFEEYWTFNRADIFDISRKLTDLTKESSITEILNNIQNYIFCILKENSKNKSLIKDIMIVEECKKQAMVGIKAPNIFDFLCLNLIF